MRFSRQSRQIRPARSRIVASAGGGGALPARTTPPVFRAGSAASATTANVMNLCTGAVAGDVIVGLVAVVAISATDYTACQWGLGHTALLTDKTFENGIGSTWGFATAEYVFQNVATASSDSAFYTTPASQSNNLRQSVTCSFTSASVDGTPTVPYYAFGDLDSELSPATIGTNTIAFPTIEVPTGYTAVYLATQPVRRSPAGSWATATERVDFASYAGIGMSGMAATLEGPHDGSGVVLTHSTLQADLAARGFWAAMVLVPGT